MYLLDWFWSAPVQVDIVNQRHIRARRPPMVRQIEMNGRKKMSDHDETLEQEHVESYEHGMLFANVKRTYDLYQDLDLTSARRSQENKDQLNNVALQALLNAVTVANKVANDSADSSNAQNKQSIRHESMAADRQWNIPDQSLEAMGLQNEGTIQDMVRKTMLDVLAEAGVVKVE